MWKRVERKVSVGMWTTWVTSPQPRMPMRRRRGVVIVVRIWSGEN